MQATEGVTRVDDGAPTLAVMLERLSPTVLDLVAAPRGDRVAATRVLLTAPDDDVPVGAGDVVVVIGGDPAAVIARAGAAGATLVIAKLADDRRETAARQAADAGVAVAAASPGADWAQVFTLLRTLVEVPDSGDATPVDLFAMADAIAAATGGATTIEDRDLRVLAYSNLDQPIDDVRRDSILGRSVPDYVMARDDMVAMYRRMWADSTVVHLPAEPDRGVRARMGAAVRAGDEVIGTMWVVEGHRPFDAAAEQALVHAAPHAALLVLQHRAAGDVARRRRADALRAALDGSGPPAIEIGADEQLRVIALGVRAGNSLDAAASVVRQQRLVELASFQFELADGRAAAVDIGEVVLVIVPERTNGARRTRDTVAEVVQKSSHALKSDVFAGIGGPVADTSRLSRSRWEAEQSLAALLEAAAGGARDMRVGSIDDLRTAVVMRRVRDVLGGDEQCRTPHLDLLAQHDRDHHTDHLATLGAYLDAFGDVAAAARRLDIHANTLRYRLKRIVSLIDVDLDDPVARFVIELQWRLR